MEQHIFLNVNVLSQLFLVVFTSININISKINSETQTKWIGNGSGDYPSLNNWYEVNHWCIYPFGFIFYIKAEILLFLEDYSNVFRR